MNNKVNFLRGTSTEYAASTKDNDTFYYTTDTKKLYLGRTEITSIEVDDTSTTATDKTWSAKKINDSIPTTLPANGGNADTVDGKHASDFVDVNDIETQIEIPSDTNNPIDVPSWITTNGKRYTRYFTYGSSGHTNVPNNSGSWVWYYFDGNNIIAREYITDNVWTAAVVNGVFTGWKLINSSDADTLDGKHASDFALKTDIPTSLPANGGNAASVGGKTITVTDVDPGAGSALSTGAIVFVTEVT